MSGSDEKWIGWNKPETIISTLAKELRIPAEYLKLSRPGTFRFNDGTTQGWTIDQFYDTNDLNMIKISPFIHPTTKQFFGFILSNSQNLALAAEANPAVALAGPNVTSLDFYLESPDLLNNQDWKMIKGYSLDVQRNFFSHCGDPIPPPYYVQLQIRMWDKGQGKMKTFGEWDAKAKKYIFHQIDVAKPYHFVWTAAEFEDSTHELRFLRIRFTQPYFTSPGSGECLPKGAWLVGNIGPET
jgi:hypothetical protein